MLNGFRAVLCDFRSLLCEFRTYIIMNIKNKS